MKKFNFIYLFLAVVGVLSLASCEHKYADYTPGSTDKNMGVYFPSTAALVVTAEDTSVEIPVARLNAEAEATISLRASDVDESGLFTIPKEVKFAAGEAESKIVITFDGTQLVPGVKYPVMIKLEEEQASAYAISEYTFNITIPEPWVSYGTGVYFDDFLNILEDGIPGGLGTYVEFEVHADNPKRIRVVNPFSMEVFANLWGGVPGYLQWNSEENHYLEFDITDSENVLVETFYELPFKINFSDAGLLQAYMFIDTNEDGSYVEPVVLEDGFIKFPKDHVAMVYPYNGSLGGWYTNAEGLMQYVLPGIEITNYSMAAEYAGMIVSADNTQASAIINFAVGADVATYKFAFAEGDVTADPSATIEAIVAGSEELTIFESDAETLRWEVELTQGAYTLVAVPYSADGEAKTDDAITLNFYFNGTGEMPEVNVDVELGVPSQLVVAEEAEATEAKMPAPYYIGVKVTANPAELKAIKFWYGDKAAVEKAGITLDQLFNEYGGDASIWIERLKENDGVMVGGFQVVNGTANTVFIRFETIYGTCIDYISEEPYVTPAYDGDFYIGQYAFQDGEGENVSQQVFGITPGNSYNDFFFTHPMIDGSQWYATYDAEASTLTVSGVERGYEQYNNQYGGIYGLFDQEGTMVYGYFSFAGEESKGNDPLVFAVENGQLKALNNQKFQMIVFNYDAANKAVGDAVGAYFTFTPQTTITTYTQEAGPAAKVMSVSSSKKAASFACGEAFFAGAGVKAEREIKATPYKGYSLSTSISLNR